MSDLWGGMRIPIVLLSGEVNSGKTLFGLLTDPNCRKRSDEAKPRTIWWDNDGSAETYAGALNFDWKDVRSAVAEGYHQRIGTASAEDPKWRRILIQTADVNDSPSASLFRAWYLHLLSIEAGRYAIAGVDTFTPIQEGLIEWMRRHPEAFGRTAGQYDKASSMFLWPDIKTVLSYILATDCRLRFQTFVLTVHLKNEWRGEGASAKKTGQRIAEGLDVLDKLCTLHLRLDRSPKAKGKEAPRVPSGIVVKERLVRFGATAADDAPILPPRLPEATADAIRAYIASPPDFAKLKPEERLPDDSLTDDQKLLIQANVAVDERVAAEANLSRMEMMRLAAQQQAPTTQVAQVASPAIASSPVSAAPPMATDSQIAELEKRLLGTFTTPQEGRDWFLRGSKGLKPSELTESAMTDCLIALAKLQSEQTQKRAAEKLAASSNGSTTQSSADGGMATQDQRDRIKALSGQLGLTMKENLAWLQQRGVQSYRSITQAQACERIAQLEAAVAPAPVGEPTPF